MKKSAIILLGLTLSLGSAFAGVIAKDAMKKYHKADDAIAKKVGKGEASDAELGELIKAYEAMKGEKPAKGEIASWEEKNDAVIAALKKVQAKDASGPADYKKAIDCKACHTVHRNK